MRANALVLGWFVVALATASPAHADDAHRQCVNGTSTNTEWADCGEALLERLNDALSIAWQKASASIDERSRSELLAEQRAWLHFKDLSCLFWANGANGREGQVLHFFTCRANIIKARISDLDKLNVGRAH